MLDGEARLRARNDAALTVFDVALDRQPESRQETMSAAQLGALAEAALGPVAPSDRPTVTDTLRRALDPAGPPGFRLTFRPLGADDWLTARGQVLFEAGSEGTVPVRLVGTVDRDAAADEEADRLRQEVATLRLAVDVTRLGVWDFDPLTGRLDWSPQMRVLFGLAPEEPVDYLRYMESIHPEDRAVVQRVLAEYSQSGADTPYQVEHRVVWPDGSHHWILGTGQVLFGRVDGTVRPVRYLGTSRDITDRKLAEEQAQRAFDEKVTLLREVHHRVKNNLQIVCSLLNLEAMRAPRESAGIMRQLAQRVRVMSEIHDQLYRSDDFGRVDLLQHLQTLCASLQRSSEVPQVAVEVTGEPVLVDLQTAIPFGLIANELVSNSLRHGFPAGRQGHVRVRLGRTPAGGYELVVSDDGIGIPPKPADGVRSLGLQLVEALAAQIDADLVASPTHAGTGVITTLRTRPVQPWSGPG